MYFEYLVHATYSQEELHEDDRALEEGEFFEDTYDLDEYGAQGWELVSVVSREATDTLYSCKFFYYKRRTTPMHHEAAPAIEV